MPTYRGTLRARAAGRPFPPSLPTGSWTVHGGTIVTDNAQTTDRSPPALGGLFQEVILSHYKRPHNKGELDAPDAVVHMRNPSCGDEIRLQLRLSGGRIEEARFMGEGCSISQASVSMMTDLVTGLTPAEAVRVARRFTDMMHGDEEAARDGAMGQLRALAGVSRFPVRVKCALLGWDALQEGLKQAEAD